MIVGTVCISHSPLLDKARADTAVEKSFLGAVSEIAEKVAQWKPDLTIVFFPDHFNGFFFDLMPSFCVGVRATSIGDFGSIPGVLDIQEDLALECAEACIEGGVDVATSWKMRVDHGAVQPVELLSEAYLLSNVLPIFINCAAHPRPSFARTRALGEAVGRWADSLDQKVLIVASGGLSHDPPLPTTVTDSSEIQNAFMDSKDLPYSARLARQTRTYKSRFGFTSGDSPLCPLNEAWDVDFMNSLVAGDIDFVDNWTDDQITKAAGRGAHEVRCWIAGLAATNPGGNYSASTEFYHPIREWLTGTGILTATKATASKK